MSTCRQKQKNRKHQLLQQIEQQRQTLGFLKNDWLKFTAPVDKGWQSLHKWRAFIVPCASIALIYALKSKPRRLLFWPRRAFVAWGAIKFIRQRLSLFR